MPLDPHTYKWVCPPHEPIVQRIRVINRDVAAQAFAVGTSVGDPMPMPRRMGDSYVVLPIEEMRVGLVPRLLQQQATAKA